MFNQSINPQGLSLQRKVRGYPVAFASAPEDFTAQTVVGINTE